MRDDDVEAWLEAAPEWREMAHELVREAETQELAARSCLDRAAACGVAGDRVTEGAWLRQAASAYRRAGELAGQAAVVAAPPELVLGEWLRQARGDADGGEA